MASLFSIQNWKKKDPKPIPIPEKIETTYKPLLVMYDIDLCIEGNIAIRLTPGLISTLFLSWLMEILKNKPELRGGIGYLWKSMRDRVLDSVKVHAKSPEYCHMIYSSCHFKGFTDGSCVPLEMTTVRFEGSRSWELMSDEDHLVVIVLKYRLTLQTFSHNARSQLRNHGFFKLDILDKAERNLLNYIGIKHLKPSYTHERGFEKLLCKLKGPNAPRVTSLVHYHKENLPSYSPSAPPPYTNNESDSE